MLVLDEEEAQRDMWSGAETADEVGSGSGQDFWPWLTETPLTSPLLLYAARHLSIARFHRLELFKQPDGRQVAMAGRGDVLRSLLR